MLEIGTKALLKIVVLNVIVVPVLDEGASQLLTESVVRTRMLVRVRWVVSLSSAEPFSHWIDGPQIHLSDARHSFFHHPWMGKHTHLMLTDCTGAVGKWQGGMQQLVKKTTVS